jgi:DNA integrity scanning protein DisA with diadenylate cyclase activity
VLGGAGALALAGGAVLASRARADAREANGAVTPGAYQAAKDRWGRHRTASAVALSAGGAALTAGLTLVFAF